MWILGCGMTIRVGIGLFTRPSFLNNKSQITNIKQITMTEIQNPKLLVIGYWNL
jgi:hypothetical protein